jgi:methyltransferase (TIGR00027 family)
LWRIRSLPPWWRPPAPTWTCRRCGPRNREAATPLQQPLLLASIYIGLRTRFIDDFLRSGQQTAQTVILGAGLDTRAYRLPWPAGARVIEIDHANVLEFKAGVMTSLSAEPTCELMTVATDLSRPWLEPLVAAGFDRQQPATWVLEGLLPYLDAAAPARGAGRGGGIVGVGIPRGD